MEELIHPDHKKQLNRLNRISGQIEALKRMINERSYCVDIITQLKAARSALKAVELEILKTHLKLCLDQSSSKQDSSREQKINEIFSLLKKYE